jgi:hypothetical protein
LKDVEKKLIKSSYDIQAVSWCLKNGYKLYPKPIGKLYLIILEYKGTKAESEKLYTKKNWSDKIWETYKHIYNKKCLERKQ